MLKRRQYVDDIVKEIGNAHNRYAGYYDKFSDLFYDTSVARICDRLYDWCKDNIRYEEEDENAQTTALPVGILTRGKGDCKHFASFIGGVLGSLNRLYGTGIKWYYYFTGYRKSSEPYHVFVSVDNGDHQIWVDPTPGAGDEDPTLIRRMKV